ncbi:hypothetical protein K435DRAFT_220103 [Dendrothele bispora CBS 962.96]|uniref:Uncharacterized protein n=1 Tax=Dendrothele bispora (strain CBS 962.96) TaxID=1314807 RepID=A0A4S8MND8_DENBC|nr:hypothetical protein K435DRAFT_220103 [Dendrothele bispora CBS 962.96]
MSPKKTASEPSLLPMKRMTTNRGRGRGRGRVQSRGRTRCTTGSERPTVVQNSVTPTLSPFSISANPTPAFSAKQIENIDSLSTSASCQNLFSSSSVPHSQWSSVSPIVTQAKELLEHAARGYGEMCSQTAPSPDSLLENTNPAFEINELTIVAWTVTGSRKGNDILCAKEHPIAIMCLGCDVEIMLFPQSGFGKPEPKATVVGAQSSEAFATHEVLMDMRQVEMPHNDGKGPKTSGFNVLTSVANLDVHSPTAPGSVQNCDADKIDFVPTEMNEVPANLQTEMLPPAQFSNADSVLRVNESIQNMDDIPAVLSDSSTSPAINDPKLTAPFSPVQQHLSPINKDIALPHSSPPNYFLHSRFLESPQPFGSSRWSPPRRPEYSEHTEDSWTPSKQQSSLFTPPASSPSLPPLGNNISPNDVEPLLFNLLTASSHDAMVEDEQDIPTAKVVTILENAAEVTNVDLSSRDMDVDSSTAGLLGTEVGSNAANVNLVTEQSENVGLGFAVEDSTEVEVINTGVLGRVEIEVDRDRDADPGKASWLEDVGNVDEGPKNRGPVDESNPLSALSVSSAGETVKLRKCGRPKKEKPEQELEGSAKIGAGQPGEKTKSKRKQGRKSRTEMAAELVADTAASSGAVYVDSGDLRDGENDGKNNVIGEKEQRRGRGRGKEKEEKAGKEEITFTLVHGDTLILDGDDFGFKLVRQGISILLVGR